MQYPPLYDPRDEHDACGVGMVAAINGQPSRSIVDKGISALKAVYHRGALQADGKTGDGAGLMIQLPTKFFWREIEQLGHQPSHEHVMAVGMLFLPRNDLNAQEACRVIIEHEVLRLGFRIYGWRQVPVNTKVIGAAASESRPEITQLILQAPVKFDESKHQALRQVERDLYLVRKRIEARLRERGFYECYLCSLSCQTITYKGLFLAEQIDSFYPELNDPLITSSFIIFHQRFSTNTAPMWQLAQPFRVLAHNGEINTVRGNINWMRTHEASMQSPYFEHTIDELKPIIPENGSDTAALDAVMELLVRCGRPAPVAKHILIPPAWSKDPTLPHAHRDFFHYCNCIMSPWDGPAAIVATDGQWLIAGMDRNGLRPMRYSVTRDGLLCAGSESGMVPLEEKNVRMRGRLGPGQIIALDMQAGQLYHDNAIKDWLAERHPYGEWVKEVLQFDDLPAVDKSSIPPAIDSETLSRLQLAAGLTQEDLKLILKPMVEGGKEGVGSMGDDTPITLLSKHYRGLHHYFRQRFSQVTNPPIDSLREFGVMSLMTRIGNRENLLAKGADQMRLLELHTPVLLAEEMQRLLAYLGEDVATLDSVFSAEQAHRDDDAMQTQLEALLAQADAAYDDGRRHFLLSDVKVDQDHIALPMVLMVSALHHRMIARAIRKQVTILVQCQELFDVHHTAVLIGLGATVVSPTLAEQVITAQQQAGKYGALSKKQALENYREAINQGLLKIMSKMGISVISSYRGGAIFEVIGLSRALIDSYFPSLTSRISGIGLRGIQHRLMDRHEAAWGALTTHPLPVGGYYNYRAEGERHAYEGQMIELIQEATSLGSYAKYKAYTQLLSEQPPVNLRDLLRFRSGRQPIDITEVEPVSEIRRRFVAPAMSLGALSPEAHEVLAVAMNRIGARSNSGEGGEGADRFKPYPNGDNANSRIKQVASGRFGVTAEYLNACDEIQIKVAQGAKPGEGGQLPGFKVTAEIAKLRHATQGVMLISPPPHHDIYSIEDLAQLIYDLKQINPRAQVSVKLVSQAGIGTIASGVAKASADKILVSGHSGGTGASPFSSIKHTGAPWEMGLAETQQVLMLNRLRHRVTLQTDGGIKSGRDIVVAAMLGAEEYGIGTFSLIALGCLLVRQCHNNTCPVGVCTQDPVLRAKFEGTVEKTIHLMTFLAEDVREILAELGFHSLDEVIGRTDLLQQRQSGSDDLDALDLGALVTSVDSQQPDGSPYPSKHTVEYTPVAETLDHQLLDTVAEALLRHEKRQFDYSIANTQRSIGTRLSSLMCQTLDCASLPEDQIALRLRGSAGQSLGAFAVRGLKLEVIGDANDYVGKGLSGGLIVIHPPASSRLSSQNHTIIGNTCLYGATAGRLFASGQAGERFAVRNSGAHAVIEGAGTNACEYMTGGMVVILGKVGNNVAAGMTGGMAFIYDPDAWLPRVINESSVIYQRVQSEYWQAQLKQLVEAHVAYTHSAYASGLLEQWPSQCPHFWQICPKEMLDKLEHPLQGTESIQGVVI